MVPAGSQLQLLDLIPQRQEVGNEMTAKPLNHGRGRVLRKHVHCWNEPGEAALEQEMTEAGPGYPPSCLVVLLTKKSTCFFQQNLFAGLTLLSPHPAYSLS